MSSARTAHGAASVLVTGLLDGPERRFDEVARTRMSVHYETGDPQVPVLTVSAPEAVRLPSAVVTFPLPAAGSLFLGQGGMWQGSDTWRVTRWWRPARPSGLRPPAPGALPVLPEQLPPIGVGTPEPAYDGLNPESLVGSGPGLTPSGDDLVAGALVTAHATADPRLPRWRATTLALLSATRTTAVSRALLRHACDGYAIDELAAFIDALCTGGDAAAAAENLLHVGHTSGAALLHGAVHTLSTHRLEGAA